MPTRDDSAGDYGSWTNPQRQSWRDWLIANGHDLAEAGGNLASNIGNALSAVGPKPQGTYPGGASTTALDWHVPPAIAGLYDSAKHLPEAMTSMNGVPEHDLQAQHDTSNALMSMYGGNALNGLRGGGAVAHAAEHVPVSSQPGGTMFFRSPFDHGGKSYAATGYIDRSGTANVGWIGEAGSGGEAAGRVDLGGGQNTLNRAALRQWRDGFLNEHPEVKSFSGVRVSGARNGERQVIPALFSDNTPSIWGAAAQGTEGHTPVRAYKGITPALPGMQLDRIESTSGPFSGFYSNSPEVASRFTASDGGAVYPVDISLANPKVLDANGKWAGEMQFDNSANPPSDPRFRGAPWSQDFIDHITDQNHDGIILKNTADEGDVYIPTKRGTVKSATTGETLFSDTGKPSLMGAAMAGQDYAFDERPGDYLKRRFQDQQNAPQDEVYEVTPEKENIIRDWARPRLRKDVPPYKA